jgi:hypothetical protein
MDKMEERIKKLEDNQLAMAREFGKQGVYFYMTLAGMRIASLGEAKYKEYETFMRDSMDKADKQIASAKSVDRVLELSNKFIDECVEYTAEQFK